MVPPKPEDKKEEAQPKRNHWYSKILKSFQSLVLPTKSKEDDVDVSARPHVNDLYKVDIFDGDKKGPLSTKAALLAHSKPKVMIDPKAYKKMDTTAMLIGRFREQMKLSRQALKTTRAIQKKERPGKHKRG